MAETKSDRFNIKTEATRPLYAYVGVTDLAVEVVRKSLNDLQQRLSQVQQDATSRFEDVRAQFGSPAKLQSQVEQRVSDLQDEVKTLPQQVRERVNGNLESANDAYGDLVSRGEKLVGRIRNQESTQQAAGNAQTTASKAKTTGTQASKAAKTAGSTAKSTSTTAKSQAKTAQSQAKKSASTTASSAKKTSTQTQKKASTAASSAKATGTAAKKTASTTAQAAEEAGKQVGNN